MAKVKQDAEAVAETPLQEQKKGQSIVRPTGIPANAVPVEACSDEQLADFTQKNKLVGFSPLRKLAWIIPSLLIAFSLIFSPAQARADFGDEATIGGEDSAGVYRWRVDSSGNLIPGTTATKDIGSSSKNVKSIYASSDITFRTSLLAVGRVGGQSSVNSSSTNLSAADIAYSIIRKRIGGGGGLDSTNGGTRLPNGTPGQMITFIVTTVQSGGSWIITPVTKTGFSTLTMDTANDLATLLYVDDTIGWIILSQAGCTVA